MSESWQVCPDTWLWEVVGIARPKLQTTLLNFLSNCFETSTSISGTHFGRVSCFKQEISAAKT